MSSSSPIRPSPLKVLRSLTLGVASGVVAPTGWVLGPIWLMKADLREQRDPESLNKTLIRYYRLQV